MIFMRHRKCGRKLNRTSAHRKSMFRNMMVALICNTIIKTTVSRAKELRSVVEPIITLSKFNTVANRRLVFSRIRNRKAIMILFEKLGPHFIARKGGYTRILKYGYRIGDCAPIAYIELVGRTDLLKKNNTRDSSFFEGIEFKR